jgi:AcrR family transcriptional regulator
MPFSERRSQLLAALGRVVQRAGLAGATVPAVVVEAGVAQGTFYRFFPSLEEAFLDLVRSSLDAVLRAGLVLERRLSSAGDRAAVEAALLDFYGVLARELATHGIALREALLVAPSGGGALGSEVGAFLGTMRTMVARMITHVSGRPPFRRLDAEVTTAAITGMVLGAARETAELGQSFDPGRWAREMARFETSAVTDCDPPVPTRASRVKDRRFDP